MVKPLCLALPSSSLLPVKVLIVAVTPRRTAHRPRLFSTPTMSFGAAPVIPTELQQYKCVYIPRLHPSPHSLTTVCSTP